MNNIVYKDKPKDSNQMKQVKGGLVNFNNEAYYKISNSNKMRPFFMSIVSDSNHWMFVSSNGGISAGRKNSESPLFPYYTDDKITELADITGSKSIFQIHLNGKIHIWEPFSIRQIGLYKITQNLYKNSCGNKVIFEEINDDLGVTFRYQWNSSNEFGFVKKSTFINNNAADLYVAVLDGIQNILPSGVTSETQRKSSNLVDAYKKCELETNVGLGIYALSAIIVDKAEPSEALKANIAWSTGIEDVTYLLSSLQLDNFRRGEHVQQEIDVKAEKGAYFVCANLNLKPEAEKTWMIVANVNQTMVGISDISEKIKNENNLSTLVQKDIELGTRRLLELVAASDGMQLTADKLRNTRHFSNTLFNIMRGGIFDDNYQIEKEDFIAYIKKANKNVFAEKQKTLKTLPQVFSLHGIKDFADKSQNKNFKRLCYEYLPLKFSRRHGDPSRPWNIFTINTTSEIDGSKILDYEGNWRDIFQNWEALAHSYPEFIENMIHKFLNATTFDGYNPYRVTKDGFDWETIEPDNPWSYIGYWGDHQIIYLLKFLEFIERHYPNKLAIYFKQDIFVYANVPYKIKSYAETLINPKDTIVFDEDSEEKIIKKREVLGADGALLNSKSASIYHVNLLEKLLATVLAKISNFIPEGGIWMNTQRPEWNDANNALVGNGVSMVTLYYLRRFLNFFETVVNNSTDAEHEISKELIVFFNKVVTTLNENKSILSSKVSDEDRRTILNGLGTAGSVYRTTIYENGFTNDKDTITKDDLLGFLDISKKYLDHSIDANKRTDKLFHSYNLMTVENDKEISISHLSEMLEGQVAVLSSGYISGNASLELLNALKSSVLFREDQYSYILYPNKELARFSEKNNIPFEKITGSKLVQELLKDSNSQIVEKDVLGNFHFNGTFNNAESLKTALSQLPEKYQTLVKEDKQFLLDVFEDIFDHKSFTGRSGTFFGYEGLGSIYWHMVSKLVLSIQEACLAAIKNNEDPVVIGKLLDHYYEANEGIGVHKSPKLYGAFPTDPYSHTPESKGAQQPGMTGQVKEDILSRFGELGVFVVHGKLMFNPCLLRREEFLKKEKTFRYVAINNVVKELDLELESLVFTYCQIPVIYKLSETENLEVVFNNHSVLEFENLTIDSQTSKQVFERTGEINQIIVSIKK